MPKQGDKYVYDYPRAGLTADVVLLDLVEGALSVLMIKRAGEPYAGEWALPGGYMEIDETLAVAALRELREETGVEPRHIEPLGVYDEIDRDPRGRTLTFAYMAIGVRGGSCPAAGDDAAEVRWCRADSLGEVAFDHGLIIADGVARLRSGVRRGRYVEHFVQERFTVVDACAAAELVNPGETKPKQMRSALRSREDIITAPPAPDSTGAGRRLQHYSALNRPLGRR